ncbi:MAG: hypothetical protein MUE94_13595 [Verrucomicrobia bacterium]|jgi:hypothetical protein|nr:hypothetical protein [Verrucomicrobiota bacterium]
MNTNEPAKNSNQQPGPRHSIVRVIAVILGAALIAFPLHSILSSVLDLPSLPFSWIVLAILAIVGLVRWRSWAKKSPALSLSSPQQAGPRPRAIFGGIALACGAAQLCCLAAAFSGKAAFDIFAIAFFLTFSTLGCALVGMARREQPKWPAAVGGLIGASPFVIFIMVVTYMLALQPMIERVGHASPSDLPAKTAPAHPPTANGTPPMAPADATAKSSGSPTNRLLSDDRLRWCAEAQTAVESWLLADTNNLFTPKYGKFVSLQGTGFVRSTVWNIQGYDYLTLHRTGHFTEGTIPVTIYVTEGAVTAPGQTNLGIPVLEGPVTAQGARIFISHPNVGKGVKAQAKPETSAVRQSQTALPPLDDKIKRQQFDQAVQRWGDEGMTAVENFLKTGTNEINSVCGDFVCFEDDGTARYQFLTTKEVSQFGGHSYLIVYNARALFSGGYILLNIYITEGRALSPRLDGIGAPIIQGSLNLHTTTALVVPHPELCSFEDFQGQDSLAYLVTDGETKLVGKYKLGWSQSTSNEPCTLELRADHSLIVSNCPTPGEPQRRVTIPGEWSLSAYGGVRIIFQLSVSGGEDVRLRDATCNLLYPLSPGGFQPLVHLTLQSTSGARQTLEFVAERTLPSPYMPRPNPHFIRRKPTGNPPNRDKPLFSHP